MDLSSQLNNSFSDLIKSYLRTNDFICALEVINDSKYSNELKENYADILLVITEYLTESTAESNPKIYDCCKTILEIIAAKLNTQDIVYELMNIIETCNEDFIIFSILPAYRICWERVTKNRLEILQWSLNSIYIYIENIHDNNEDEDCRIFNLCDALMNFCNEVNQRVSQSEEFKTKQDYLVQFLIKLIGKPIAYLNYKSLSLDRYKIFINKLLKLLNELVFDIYSFLNNISENNEFRLAALGTVYYLLFIENEQYTCVKVYNMNYIARNLMFLSSVLLKESNDFLINQGIQLSCKILDVIDCLNEYELEGNVYNTYFLSLSNVIIYNDSVILRKSALKNISKCILKFNDKGRYLLLQNFLPLISHSGLKGCICTLYKDMLREAFDKHTKLPMYYQGKYLLDILCKFTNLSAGSTTDLLDLADLIIPALNCLRFLMLRDKDNLTKIWDNINVIQETFLIPLRESLKVTRTQYEIKLKELNDEKKVTKEDIEFEVSIGNGKLADLPLSNKIYQPCRMHYVLSMLCMM